MELGLEPGPHRKAAAGTYRVVRVLVASHDVASVPVHTVASYTVQRTVGFIATCQVTSEQCSLHLMSPARRCPAQATRDRVENATCQGLQGGSGPSFSNASATLGAWEEVMSTPLRLAHHFD